MRLSAFSSCARGAVALTLIASMSLWATGCDDGSSSARVDDAASTGESPAAVPVVDQPEASKPVEATPDMPDEPVGPALVDGPRIVFDQTFHDFGIISDMLPVSFDFVFHNQGNEVLKIGNVKASCGCTAAAPTKNEYLPGEEGSIHVTFKPKGRSGHQAKSIRVNSNDPENKITNLRISSDILAAVNVEPKVFRFNEVEAGHAKTIVGEIRVRGDGFKVTDINVNGPYAKAEILGTESIEVSGMPATTTKVEVTVLEDAPLGWLDRRVIVKTDNPERPSLEVTLWANVLGPIEIQPAKLPLGVVRAGQPFRRELRLVSRAGDLFKLTDWKIDSDDESLEMKVELAGEIPDEGVSIMRLIVTGTGPEQIGKLQGNIVLTTSMDKDRDINVPFHCVVRPAK
jgi:Protein of unknown function (DUF1573)